MDEVSSLDDELLECLVTVATVHEHDVNRDALTAGLPLEGGRLTPGVFPRAASRAGLSARLVKSRLVQLNPELFPAVLLLEPGRACVLLGLDLQTRRARVVFPELGEAATEVDLDGLQASFSGQAIYARPRFHFDTRGPEVQRPRGRHWFWGVIRENRRLYRDVIAGSVVINIFALAMPLFVLNVYDRVVPNHATETLWVLAVGAFVVLGFDLALRLMRSAFVDLAASRADVKLSSTLMSQVLGLRMEARPASTGSFASMLQSFESVRAFIGSATVVGLVDLPFVLMFAAIIALIGPALVIPVLVGVAFVLLYALSAQGKLHELSQASQEASGRRNATLVESISQLETLKALRGESRVQGIWERASAFLSRTNAQLRLVGSSVTSVAQWAQHSVAVVIIIIGVYLIVDGELTQGGLIAAYMLSSRAMAPVSQAAALLSQYHQASTALEALDGMMALPVERSEGQSFIDRPIVRGDLALEHASFRYPDEQRDALRDVSLSIKAGEKVAVLGRVGCGKTTLHKLLLGLYEPTSGGVRLDGVDIRQFEPAQLRRHFGYVPQDVTLFQGTLRDNIIAGAGNDRIDDQSLLRAIRLSGLGSLVDSHPSGLDLEVGERGQRLSGGQRQQVAIARALIHDPPIFLFDEPSSAMDHSSEEALKGHLKEAIDGKTMIVITHRTSLLPLVDRIVVLDGGKAVADGPRDKVLEALRTGKVGRARA
ncbi:type I secretion system permease/ATPase [Halomonas sp. THAF12]|uniref:type I secretion system permease/ATPase n=1 Tax=Halomonas sp. B23F22_10 TaxID=3459515 RepID=UPI00373E1299